MPASPNGGEGNGVAWLQPAYLARITLRSWHLLVISIVLVSATLAYDVPGVIAPYLKRELGISGEALAMLYSVYHMPNVVLVLLGGLLVDSIGPDVASVGLTGIVLISAIVLTSGMSMTTLIASRVLLGVGGETLGVAQMTLLNRAFDSGKLSRPDCAVDFPSVAVAYAFSTVVARLGTLTSFHTLPALLHAHGWKGMHLVTGVSALSLLFACLLLCMERGWVRCCSVAVGEEGDSAGSSGDVAGRKRPPAVAGPEPEDGSGGGDAEETDAEAEGRPLLPMGGAAAFAPDDAAADAAPRLQHRRPGGGAADRRPGGGAADRRPGGGAAAASATAAAAAGGSTAAADAAAVAVDNEPDLCCGLCDAAAAGGSKQSPAPGAAVGAAGARRGGGGRRGCGVSRLSCGLFSADVCTPALGVHAAFLLLFYAASLPFSEVSTALFAAVYGYSDERAGATSGIQTLVGIAVIIPLGLLLDYKLVSYHAMMLAGAALVVPAWALLAVASPAPPEVAAVLTGLGNAAVNAAAWPLLVFRLPLAVQGRVLGAAMAAQNALMVVSPLIVGALRDHAVAAAAAAAAAARGGGGGGGGGAGGTGASAGFGPALWYMVALALVCVCLLLWLGALDGWDEPVHRCHEAAAAAAAPAAAVEGSGPQHEEAVLSPPPVPAPVEQLRSGGGGGGNHQAPAVCGRPESGLPSPIAVSGSGSAAEGAPPPSKKAL